jgi:hypothetical protein
MTPIDSIARTVPLGGDLQLRVSAESTDGGVRMLQLQLERRAPAGSDADPAAVAGEFVPTAARLRCPLHLAPLLVETIERVAKRASQSAIWQLAPSPDQDAVS